MRLIKVRNIKFFLPIVILLMSSCASTPDGQVSFIMQINTVDKHDTPISAKCSLFSTTTKLTIDAPAEISYVGTCGPINVYCEKDDLKGEQGVFPITEEEKIVDESLFLATGIGYAFDRMVDAITPFGAFLNYSAAFRGLDGKVCLIPRTVRVVLE